MTDAAPKSFGQQCAAAIHAAKLEHAKAKLVLTMAEAAKIIDDLDIARPALVAPKPKRRAPETEDEWLARLKADPFLAPVNFATELAACQFWCRTHKAQCSRRRVENWMRKAAKDAAANVEVAARGGPESHAPLPDPGPAGWLAWTRENMPGWIMLVHEEQHGTPVPPWHKLDASTKQAIREQMRRVTT